MASLHCFDVVTFLELKHCLQDGGESPMKTQWIIQLIENCSLEDSQGSPPRLLEEANNCKGEERRQRCL